MEQEAMLEEEVVVEWEESWQCLYRRRSNLFCFVFRPNRPLHSFCCFYSLTRFILSLATLQHQSSHDFSITHLGVVRVVESSC